MFNTTDTPISEPIEIRLAARGGRVEYVFVAWLAENGLIGTSLTQGGAGTPLSVSNLQLGASMPRKAYPGWQVEVLAVVGTGPLLVGDVR